MAERQTPWKPSHPAMKSQEISRSCSLDAGGDQVLDDLVLGVERDGLAAGQLVQIDPVRLSGEAQVDSPVHGPLALHPFAEAHLGQQIDRALLEHAGPDGRLDLRPAAQLEHDGLDPLQVQEVGEQQPCRAGPDDADLRAHARCLPQSGIGR